MHVRISVSSYTVRHCAKLCVLIYVIGLLTDRAIICYCTPRNIQSMDAELRRAVHKTHDYSTLLRTDKCSTREERKSRGGDEEPDFATFWLGWLFQFTDMRVAVPVLRFCLSQAQLKQGM
jgi:hypothetical protein